MPRTTGLEIMYLAIKITGIWIFVPDDTKYHMIEDCQNFVINLAM